MLNDTNAPIPVTLLTGFLGSGKTTLLNQLVRQPAMRRALVIINEFGAIALDHQLFSATDDVQLVTLDSGCLCCAVRGDLLRTLRDAPWRFSRQGQRFFDRVIIETTGLADPAPILHTLMTDERLARSYRLDGIVATVDAAHGQASLDRHIEARRQVAVADRLLLTKTDLASAETHAALHQRLATLNTGAERIDLSHGQIDASRLIDLSIDRGTPSADAIHRWLGPDHGADTRLAVKSLSVAEQTSRPPIGPWRAQAASQSAHDARIQTYSFTLDTPIERVRLHSWLELTLALMGERMLRIKGLLDLADTQRPTVLHGVQHILHPLTELPDWPDDDHRSRLVFITHDIPRHTLDGLMTALDA